MPNYGWRATSKIEGKQIKSNPINILADVFKLGLEILF